MEISISFYHCTIIVQRQLEKKPIIKHASKEIFVVLYVQLTDDLLSWIGHFPQYSTKQNSNAAISREDNSYFDW